MEALEDDRRRLQGVFLRLQDKTLKAYETWVINYDLCTLAKDQSHGQVKLGARSLCCWQSSRLLQEVR